MRLASSSGKPSPKLATQDGRAKRSRLEPSKSTVLRGEELCEYLIRSSVDGILAFDREFRYTVWNSAMERISGMSKTQTLGRCAFDVFPFLKETGEDKFLREVLLGKTVITRDRPYRIPETGREGVFEG